MRTAYSYKLVATSSDPERGTRVVHYGPEGLLSSPWDEPGHRRAVLLRLLARIQPQMVYSVTEGEEGSRAATFVYYAVDSGPDTSAPCGPVPGATEGPGGSL